MSHTETHTDGRKCSGMTAAGRECRNLAYRSIGASETSDHRPYCHAHTAQGEAVAVRAAQLDAMPTGEEWGDRDVEALLDEVEERADADAAADAIDRHINEAAEVRDPLAGPRKRSLEELTAAVADEAPIAERYAEVRDEVYERAGLPTAEMGQALGDAIAAEARQLGYASTSDYLNDDTRENTGVLARVEAARQRAVVEAVVMTPEAARAHVTAAVLAAAEVDEEPADGAAPGQDAAGVSDPLHADLAAKLDRCWTPTIVRGPEDARALNDEGRDLAEERAARAEADEEAAGELSHEETRAAVVAALRHLSAVSVARVEDTARRIAEDAPMRLTPDGFRLLVLARSGHVAALAVRAAAAVESAVSYDLVATVEGVTGAYLVEHSPGDESEKAKLCRFAVSRVELCARQIVAEDSDRPVSV